MFSTADLCDAHPEVAVLAPILRSYGGRAAFHGPIRTVRVLEDNVLVVEALESIEPGEVLVVDGAGSERCALLGDRLGQIARDRNLGGAVINGMVRDTAELGRLEVGILARGPSPRRSHKRGEGKRDAAVEFGGVIFRPGDHLYADADGVIVSSSPLI